jgi:methyl coenzyme M reductase alpha subunit
MPDTLATRTKTKNRLAGAALIIAGTALSSFGTFGLVQYQTLSKHLAEAFAAPAAMTAVDAAAPARCEAALRTAGAQVSITGAKLHAAVHLTVESLPEVQAAVYGLSLAAAQCGLKVQSFCAGPSCPSRGLDLELSLPTQP